MPDIRLLIVADDLLVRAGLAAMVDSESGLTVVGRSASGTDLSVDITVYRPDVALIDAGHDAAPDDIAPVIEADLPPVILLAGLDESVRDWLNAVSGSPACGLIHRDSSAETINATIRAVHSGLVTLSPELFAAWQSTQLTTPPPTLLDELTPREHEVLQLLAEGLSNKLIAVRLNISANTVKFHVNAILSKLDAHTRTEAVVRATQLGLIAL